MCFCKELHSLKQQSDQSFRRRVQFNETLTVTTLKNDNDGSDGQDESDNNNNNNNERWYGVSDLDHFKKYARNTSRLVRENASLFLGLPEDEFCMRGLEFRISRERRERTKQAIRTVCKAQCRIEDPEKIAIISKIMTGWAQRIAYTTGEQDYCSAYPCTPVGS